MSHGNAGSPSGAIRSFSRVRTTIWNLLTDYGNVLYALASGMLIAPLAIKHIPIALYGAWLASGNILAWLGALDPGIGTVLAQRVAVAFGKGDRHAIGRLVSAGLVLNGLVLVLVGVAGFAVVPALLHLANLSSTVNVVTLLSAVRWAVANTVLSMAFFGLFAVAQGLQSPGVGLVFTFGNLLGLASQVLFLLSDYGLLALPFGGMVRSTVLVIGGTVYVRQLLKSDRIVLSGGLADGRALLGATSFTFLARLFETAASNLDALAVSRYLGSEHVPMLRFTRTPIDAMHMLVIRPSVALTPALSHLHGEGDTSRTRAVVMRLLRISVWSAILVGSCLFILNRQFVSLWVGPKFFAGPLVNLALCCGFVLNAILANMGNAAFALGGVHQNGISRAVQSGVTVLVLVVAAQRWGMLGIVLAPLVGLLVAPLWYLPSVLSSILTLGRLDWFGIAAEVAKALAAAALTWVLSRLFSELASWPDLIAAGAAVATAYLVSLGFLSSPFRREATAILCAVLGRVCKTPA